MQLSKTPGGLGISAANLTNEMSSKHFIRWMSGASFMKVRLKEHGKLDQ